jgi:hypothetical protein
VGDSNENKQKWATLSGILKKMRTLRHSASASQSLCKGVDLRTALLNKGGLFLPPTELEGFTTEARKIIASRVSIARFHITVLEDAAEAVNSNVRLQNIWEHWYTTCFTGNPDTDNVYGEIIRRALLSKLINSAFGVVLKSINARYTQLAKNKKMKLTLREELKVTTGYGGGVDSTSTSNSVFQSVLLSGKKRLHNSDGDGGGGDTAQESDAPLFYNDGDDLDILLQTYMGEFERETFGVDVGDGVVEEEHVDLDLGEDDLWMQSVMIGIEKGVV